MRLWSEGAALCVTRGEYRLTEAQIEGEIDGLI